jgi:hypothetical protein
VGTAITKLPTTIWLLPNFAINGKDNKIIGYSFFAMQKLKGNERTCPSCKAFSGHKAFGSHTTSQEKKLVSTISYTQDAWCERREL